MLVAPPNKVLQQTGLSLAKGSLWRPQLNAGTLGGLEPWHLTFTPTFALHVASRSGGLPASDRLRGHALTVRPRPLS
jgi:hypothetical protein